jgi:hypothetical protein
MKTDEEIDALLRSSPSPMTLGDDFAQEVWRRVERVKKAPVAVNWVSQLEAVLASFFRPARLAVGFALALALGFWLGWGSEKGMESEQLAYVQSISPFKLPAAKTP